MAYNDKKYSTIRTVNNTRSILEKGSLPNNTASNTIYFEKLNGWLLYKKGLISYSSNDFSWIICNYLMEMENSQANTLNNVTNNLKLNYQNINKRNLKTLNIDTKRDENILEQIFADKGTEEYLTERNEEMYLYNQSRAYANVTQTRDWYAETSGVKGVGDGIMYQQQEKFKVAGVPKVTPIQLLNKYLNQVKVAFRGEDIEGLSIDGELVDTSFLVGPFRNLGGTAKEKYEPLKSYQSNIGSLKDTYIGSGTYRPPNASYSPAHQRLNMLIDNSWEAANNYIADTISKRYVALNLGRVGWYDLRYLERLILNGLEDLTDRYTIQGRPIPQQAITGYLRRQGFYNGKGRTTNPKKGIF